MADNSKRTGAAVEAHYQFLLWLLPTVEKFPKSHKFTLGDRIETIALNVLEALIEATYTRDRADALRSGPFWLAEVRVMAGLAPATHVFARAAVSGSLVLHARRLGLHCHKSSKLNALHRRDVQYLAARL